MPVGTLRIATLETEPCVERGTEVGISRRLATPMGFEESSCGPGVV